MLKDRVWIVYNTTEGDFIEYERCTERLRLFGLNREMIENMALRCSMCLLPRPCRVNNNDLFLGARTC